MHKNIKRRIGLVVVALLLLVAAVPAVSALELSGGDTVVIAAGEVVEDDLYVAADSFTLNGTVAGDLFVVGSDIVINGTVEGDLMAAGQSIIINGTVADDARIAGMALEIGPEASIGDDVLAGGYSLHAKPGSSVAGSVLLGGYQGLLEGDIAEVVRVGANRLQINGRLADSLIADVAPREDAGPDPTTFMTGNDVPAMPAVAPGLNFGAEAAIVGDVTYRASTNLSLPEEQIGGTVDFERVAVADEAVETASPAMERLWRSVRGFVAVLLIGLLAVWRLPILTERTRTLLHERPGPALVWGAIVYFGLPILVMVSLVTAILLAVVFGQIGLGNVGGVIMWTVLAALIAVMAAFVLVLLYVTKIIVGYHAGHWILSRTQPSLVERPYAPLVLGLVIIMVLIAIPWLGVLINWAIALVGVGALWLLWRSRIPTAKKPAAA